MSDLVIPSRFEGPPGWCNGGYACGLVADLVGSDARVRLRRPIPLGRPLRLERTDGGAALKEGDEVLVEAVPAEVPLPDVPAAAEVPADARYGIPLDRHPFPRCFVCGSDRLHGDALCIHGKVVREGVVACDWTAPAELADERGALTRICWAALDCPGAWGVAAGGVLEPHVLGTLEAHAVPLVPGRRYRVVGWHRGGEGRKQQAGAALLDEGRPVAWSLATWIAVGREWTSAA